MAHIIGPKLRLSHLPHCHFQAMHILCILNNLCFDADARLLGHESQISFDTGSVFIIQFNIGLTLTQLHSLSKKRFRGPPRLHQT